MYECEIKECGIKEFGINFSEINSPFLTPWHLFSIFNSICHPIFKSFTIFNFTYFENFIPKSFNIKQILNEKIKFFNAYNVSGMK